ncbi:MAG TPA: M14 family metallopeptidase [Candidatus Paceibacterota bacterium]
MNKTLAAIIVIIVVLLAAGGAYYFATRGPSVTPAVPAETATTTMPEATTTATTTADNGTETIGTSVQGRAITAYHYGTGSDEILFVGGIHGGYESNTSLVAYQLMDYLDANPNAIPANERVTVIPDLNPDGTAKVVGTDGRFSASDVPSDLASTIPGRYNGNGVDLNRNFDCDWQATGTWQNTSVNGGTSAFSEPESQAIRTYVGSHSLKAVIVWYSAAGGVYASNCHNGVLPETQTLTDLYAKASGYPAHASYDYYEITGDMVNWLAKQGVPGISVLLTDHTSTEWSKNQAGVDAVLAHYAQ